MGISSIAHKNLLSEPAIASSKNTHLSINFFDDRSPHTLSRMPSLDSKSCCRRGKCSSHRPQHRTHYWPPAMQPLCHIHRLHTKLPSEPAAASSNSKDLPSHFSTTDPHTRCHECPRLTAILAKVLMAATTSPYPLLAHTHATTLPHQSGLSVYASKTFTLHVLPLP